MGKEGIDVGLLTSDNYWQWSILMQSLLVQKDLEDCLFREPAADATVAQKHRDRKAMTLIWAHVSPNLLSIVAVQQTAKGTWDALTTMHDTGLAARRMILEKDLSTLKKEKTETIFEYCARADRIRLQLNSDAHPVSEERIRMAILQGLPKEYAYIRNTLTLMPDISMQLMTSQLRAAEQQISSDADEEAVALKAVPKRDLSRVKCYNCQKFGHYKRDCPHKGAHGRGRNWKQKANDSMAAIAMAGGNHEKVMHAASMRGENGKGTTVEWVIDSGATQHVLKDAALAKNMRSTDICLMIADGSSVKAAGVCDLQMTTWVGRRCIDMSLSNVLVVPQAPYNLFSGPTATRHKLSIEFLRGSGTGVLRNASGHVTGIARPGERGLSFLTAHWAAPAAGADVHVGIPTGGEKMQEQALCASRDSATLWHRRLGHLSYAAIAKMARDGSFAGGPVDAKQLQAKIGTVCKTCVEAKHAADSHRVSDSRATSPLQLVHSDLMGPMRPASAGGSEYILTVVDDYSGYAQVIPLKHKSDASKALRELLLTWERQLNAKVKRVRTDRGGEYVSFDRWCATRGIMRERSVAYTPQQNGRAERFNRTVTQKARAMMLDSTVAKKFWADAFKSAVVVYNVSARMTQPKTPYEMFWGLKPDVSHLRVWGCKAFCQRKASDRKKLTAWSDEGRFIGYDDGTKGWKVLLNNGKVIVRSNVKFVEVTAAEENDGDQRDAEADRKAAEPVNEAPDHDDMRSEAAEDPEADHDEDAGAANAPPEQEENPVDELQVPQKRNLPPRTREPSKKLKDSYALMSTDGLPDEPELHVAKQQPDWPLWEKSIDDEMNSLIEMKVFEIIEQPDASAKPLKCKWVLKRKRTKEGHIERYKARLVAKGFTQQKGIDYNEVFASVVKHSTVRAMLAMAAVEDLEIEQIDVKTAFLNGPLYEDIYMEIPELYEFGKGKVLHLKRALYGLKQAARAWHQELNRVLMKYGFEVSYADDSLFVFERNGRRSFLLIYVDDGLVIGCKADVNQIISILAEEFDIRKLGGVSYFLSMVIQRDRNARTITLNQKKYSEEILQRGGMLEAKPKSIPLAVNLRLSSEGDDPMEDSLEYAAIVGKLMYLATCTRPDLAYAVGLLARFMSKPRDEHWRCVKWLLQYLKQTSSLGLQYGGEQHLEFEGYSDSDYAADPDKRRSTRGFVFLFAGGAIEWSSKLLPTVATSTMEAEYMAAAAAAKTALWTRKLMATIQGGDERLQGTKLYCDNQAAIALMKNPVHHQRAKHIDVCHHFIQERVLRGELIVGYVSTKEMVADMLTKALPKPQLEYHRAKLGLIEICEEAE